MSFNQKLLILALSAICLGELSWASHVLWVDSEQQWFSVAYPSDLRWRLGESLCVVRGKEKIACGTVEALLPKGARVRVLYQKMVGTQRQSLGSKSHNFVALKFLKEEIRIGDWVKVALPPPSAESVKGAVVSAGTQAGKLEPVAVVAGAPTSTEQLTSEKSQLPESEREPYRGLSSAFEGITAKDYSLVKTATPLSALSAGLTNISPQVHFQMAPGDHFGSGLQVSYLNLPVGESTVQGTGYSLTFCYFVDRAFRGLAYQLAFGIHNLVAKAEGNSEFLKTTHLSPSLGWYWWYESGFSFKMAGGFDYFFSREFVASTVTLPSIVPHVSLEMGITF